MTTPIHSDSRGIETGAELASLSQSQTVAKKSIVGQGDEVSAAVQTDSSKTSKDFSNMALPVLDPPESTSGTAPQNASEILDKIEDLLNFIKVNSGVVGDASVQGNPNFGANVRFSLQKAMSEMQKMLSLLALNENARQISETATDFQKLKDICTSMQTAANVSRSAEMDKAYACIASVISTLVSTGVQLTVTAYQGDPVRKKLKEEIATETTRRQAGVVGPLDKKTAKELETFTKRATDKADKQIEQGINTINQFSKMYTDMFEGSKRSAEHVIDARAVMAKTEQETTQEFLKSDRELRQKRADTCLQKQKEAHDVIGEIIRSLQEMFQQLSQMHKQ